MESNPICHLSLAKKKMKCYFLDYVQLLMIGLACWWTRIPSATPLQLIKWNAHFWNTFNFWWSAGLVNGLEPHLPALSSQKKWNAHFSITINFWFRPDWSVDSNPIHHPSPTNKMKCLFLDYAQLLMIGLAGWWTRTPFATPLQPKKWNATFWITFNFWWLAGLVNGLKPHPPPLSSQRNEMLVFVLCSTSNDQPGLSVDLNPIHHLSPAKKWNAHIMIMFNFWWLAGLVNGLETHPPPLSSQKMKSSFFILHSTSDIGQTDQWTQTPSTTPLQPKKWNACF